MWCANQVEEYKKAIPNNAACADMLSYYSKKGLYHKASSDYVPQKGDIVFFDTKNNGVAHHVEFVAKSGITTKNGAKAVVCIGGNTSDSNFKGHDYVAQKTRKISQSGCKIMGYAHPSYSASSYSFKSQNDTPSKRTNTTNEITGTLNKEANIKTWGYYFGTSETDVKNHNDLKNNKCKYVTVMPSNSGKKMKTFTVTVTGLKPNTDKYWYVIKAVTTGGQTIYSKGFYGRTTNNKPETTKLTIDSVNKDIGINGTPTVKWNTAKYADSYTIRLYNSSGVLMEEKTVKGTSHTFAARCFKETGEYTAKLTANNAAGSTTCEENVTITVHPNLTVEFYDTVSKETIDTQSVVYGKSADKPANPVQNGYTFQNWDKDFEKVTQDMVVNTVYSANKYAIKFIDGYSNEVLKNEKYTYLKTLDSQDYPEAPAHKNYRFTGWSEENYTVASEDHSIYAKYEWDLPTDIAVEIKSVDRAKSDLSQTINDGYNIGVQITLPAVVNKVIKGRVIVALKTSNDRLLIETESSAFVMYPNGSEQIKDLNIFVPYEAMEEDLAAKTEVFIVNKFASAGIISNVDTDTQKTAASNTDEWQYSLQKPVVGENNVVAIDDSYNRVTYDLITNTTKESLQTSLDGYGLLSSRWSNVVASGDINYVDSWPSLGNTAGVASKNTYGSAFNNTTYVGKTLYNWFNNKANLKSASETDTTKTTVSKQLYGNIYYHWCCNRNNGTLTHNVTGNKYYADKTTGNKYYTFHANYKHLVDGTLSKTYDKSLQHEFYVRNLSNTTQTEYRDKCTDSKYWHNCLPVYQQHWESQRKIYTYSKSDTEYELKASDIDEIPAATTNTTSQNDSGVQLNTTVTKSAANVRQWYAYKTEVNVSHEDKNEYDINVSLGSDYIDKDVVVYVYKDSQVADYTTEYIGTTHIGTDGTLFIENAQMREKCSKNTGDFTIAVALPCETNATVVGKIEAPKPTYTVKYYDSDKTTVIYQEDEVEEGKTVTAPSKDLLTIPKGYRFVGWDLSTVGVHSDLNVKPIFELETYVVTFVDWGNQEVTSKELKYGDTIEEELPTIKDMEGITESWDLSECETITKTVQGIDEDTGEEYSRNYQEYIVTGNTVIMTKYETETNDIVFISPKSPLVTDPANGNIDSENIVINDEDIVDDVVGTYGERIETPAEVEENPDIIFCGWKNITTGEYLEDTQITENAIYVPEYQFADTVELPVASVNRRCHNFLYDR